MSSFPAPNSEIAPLFGLTVRGVIKDGPSRIPVADLPSHPCQSGTSGLPECQNTRRQREHCVFSAFLVSQQFERSIFDRFNPGPFVTLPRQGIAARIVSKYRRICP